MRLLQGIKKVIPVYIKDIIKILNYKRKYHYKKGNSNEKCVIFFLVSRTNIFSSVQSVFVEANNDDQIEAYLVALPDRSSDKANMDNSTTLQFCNSIAQDRVINCFDNRGEFVDLKKYNPDYIFLGIPYNEEYPAPYRFNILASFTRLCFIPYGYGFVEGVVMETSANNMLLSHVSYIFSDGPVTFNYCHKRLAIIEKVNGEIIYSLGFPRFDLFTDVINNANRSTKCNKTIAYFPRWTTIESEKNGHEPSSFMVFKDKILDFAEHNKEYTIIIRPHPLLFSRFVQSGMLSQIDLENYRERISKITNVILDESKDYRDTLLSTDIMITDYSSTIAEFLLTGRPVLFFGTYKNISKEHKPIFDNLYHIHNWEEVEKEISSLNQYGDWMYENRMSAVNTILKPNKEFAGRQIIQKLKVLWEQNKKNQDCLS